MFALICAIAVRFYYPGSILAWDLVSIFAYAIVESSRLFLGQFGKENIFILFYAYPCLLSDFLNLSCSIQRKQNVQVGATWSGYFSHHTRHCPARILH